MGRFRLGERIFDQESMLLLSRAQYIIVALLSIIITIIGFWQSYYGPLFKGTLDTHWAIDVHAGIFLLWLILFLGQAVLAFKKKIATHIKTGTYIGIFWGVLLLLIGLLITFAVIVPGIGRDHEVGNYAGPLLGSLGDIITFGIFFIVAVVYRKKTDYHKRLMVLATVALLGAPVVRLDLGGGLTGFAFFVILRLLPLIVAMGYDRWLQNKVHIVYWVGLGILLLNISRLFWSSTETWQAISACMTKSIKPVMESIF